MLDTTRFLTELMEFERSRGVRPDIVALHSHTSKELILQFMPHLDPEQRKKLEQSQAESTLYGLTVENDDSVPVDGFELRYTAESSPLQFLQNGIHADEPPVIDQLAQEFDEVVAEMRSLPMGSKKHHLRERLRMKARDNNRPDLLERLPAVEFARMSEPAHDPILSPITEGRQRR